MKKINGLQTFFLNVVAFFTLVVGSIFISNSATAHPGHDHSATESLLIHVLFYGSIVVAVLACAWFIYRKFYATKKNK